MYTVFSKIGHHKILKNTNHIISGGDYIMESFDKEKKEKQLDNLINITEKYTRTERHLEQYSHIGSEDNKENARRKQELREKQIEDLKSAIKEEDNIQTQEEQLENLKNRYISTTGYINHNKDTMNEEMLENLEKKQENRKIQLENLEDN